MYRDTQAIVQLGVIRNNVEQIRQALPSAVKLMAVVKADGYGHGDLETAAAAEQAGADMLAVAYLDEALKLRARGSRLPILILTPIHPCEVLVAIEHDFMVTVTSDEWFRGMLPYWHSVINKKLKVHVKLDTGLGRLGLKTREEWEKLVPYLQSDNVEVDGVYTHFATAGNADTTFLERQYKRFNEMRDWCASSGIAVKHFHCAGSASALRFPALAMDMVRIGAAMFGFYPKPLIPDLRLAPALRLSSRLIQAQKVRRGECVGYDNSYVAEADEWIGTVPIGYADGWSQALQGSVMLVDGQRVPIVGKICMDQLMVRLPAAYDAGEEVVLIGRQGDDEITFAELASRLGSVPQEISTAISGRVDRIYMD
jgi:alanine racemase